MFFPLTQRKDEVFCYVKIERKRVGSKSFSFFFEVKQKFLRHETFVSLRRNFCFLPRKLFPDAGAMSLCKKG